MQPRNGLLFVHILFLIMHFCLTSKGGYDLLGRTKDQIRTSEQVNAAMSACQELNLTGLVIIGGESNGIARQAQNKLCCLRSVSCPLLGVTSHTDAAQLAETFVESKCQTKVSVLLHLSRSLSLILSL